ncbi:TonB-dependent receptor [Hyphomonas sp. WL0036]|uniref:TonB-dependent receptor n=1 Tax=Hyphomonas sediminis TaxID=2866160 RepID=UPI001C80D3E4|nr:TonB-dependent receptor [Hyphomonas sediminis]MBY9065796.1 TonB-dependent receptor [Hyphomonas sediminis]
MFDSTFLGRGLTARLLASSILATAIAVPAAMAGTVTGEVADSSGTRSLRGAEVTLVELNQSAEVGQDGSYRFVNVPAGTYTLRVRYPGAEEQTRVITLVDNAATVESFALAPRGAQGDTAVMDTVLVIGQQANLLNALARQRASDTVDTVLSRDAIGQFPDQNVAEALRRAPGLNVLNDQGEGRFVSVRGLDPNLNSASINGNRVLATGGDERAVALDVIPSELIESIEIKKSLTPDMDADTIGGSIEINTTSAFDRKKDLFSMSFEGSYNDLNGKTSPKGSIDFIKLIGDRVGLSGGFSYYDRQFSTDNIEMDGWQDDGYAEDLEYRDYDVRRERYGFTLGADFRATENTNLYVRGLYSKFDDTELRRRLVFGFDEPTSIDGNSASFDSADGRIQVRRDLKDRREIQTIRTVSAGGETVSGPWTVNYDIAYSEADQTEDGSLDPMRFQARFQTPGALGVTVDYSDMDKPAFNIDFGEAAFNDPSNYGFTLLERTTRERAKDKETSVKFDVAREFALSNGTLEVKSGAKLRQRDKTLAFQYDIYDDYDGDFTLADVAGSPSYGLADLGVVPALDRARAFIAVNGLGAFELNELDTAFASTVEGYEADEQILAGYLMGKYQSGPLRVIGGVRVEKTELNANGNRAELVEEGAIVDGLPLDEDTLFVTPVSISKDYTDVLPSLNIRYDVSDKIVARFGAFQSIVRPSFGKMAPRFIIEENDDNERTGEFGNPDLDPYRATNFDATLEYYFSPEAVIQGGVFYKKIDDFIVDAEFLSGEFNGIAYDEATIPINGDTAEVRGFEFSYAQAFTMLPAPFDGLVTNLNYTYTDAEGDVLTEDGSRSIPLPTSAEHTYNIVLGYEKGPISLRLSGAGRSSYLDELGSDPEADRYVKPHFQVDASAKYRINQNFQLFAEMVNINDATYTAYQKRPEGDRLLQYEEYGWTAKFGFKANF